MAVEPQFHMTVVTQKRVLRGEGSHIPGEEAHAHAEAPEKQPDGEPSWPAAEEAAKPVPVERISHHRRYLDYGTVDLGSLDEARAPEQEAPPESPAAAPTHGELQQEFLNKYDAVLNRRYFTRDKGKAGRIIVICLLVALIFVIGLFAISSLTGNVAETLEAPEISTLPVETLDLG